MTAMHAQKCRKMKQTIQKKDGYSYLQMFFLIINILQCHHTVLNNTFVMLSGEYLGKNQVQILYLC